MLIVRQRVVGSSGHIHRPQGGLRANYHNCHSHGATSSTWYKSMINTRIVHSARFDNPHFPTFCDECQDPVTRKLLSGCPGHTWCVDEHMRRVRDYTAPVPLMPSNLSLYHYLLRSKEVGGVCVGGWGEWYSQYIHTVHTVHTDRTQDFALKIKRGAGTPHSTTDFFKEDWYAGTLCMVCIMVHTHGTPSSLHTSGTLPTLIRVRQCHAMSLQTLLPCTL